VSTPVLTQPEILTTARTVLSRMSADDFIWPSGKAECTSLRECRDGLAEALDDYEALARHQLQPAALFPDLGHRQDDARDIALRRTADDVLEWAQAAVLVVRERCAEG
jgi:hypothetical protein